MLHLPTEFSTECPAGRKDWCIPFLHRPLFPDGSLRELASARSEPLSGVQEEVLRRLQSSDATVEDLATLVSKREPFPTYGDARERIETAYARQDNMIRAIRLRLATAYDVAWVEQGYGGVYVHSAELVKLLRKTHRVLLIAPEDPLFESGRHEDDLTVPRLRDLIPEISFYTYAQIVRCVTHCIPTKLMVIGHRSQSMMLFDRINRIPTIIYCDGYYDGGLRMASQLHLDVTPENELEILRELHFLMGNGPHNFFNILSNPTVNFRVLQSAYAAMLRARENWCWGNQQAQAMSDALPFLRDKISFEPPFLDPEIFLPDAVDRRCQVLFTTTMHNIEKKGLPELVAAMEAEPLIDNVRVVLRQPEKAPGIPEHIKSRMVMGAVTKPEMITLYHQVWVNCRVSREESSPMSILESMICEVPQIVSPQVADQIPLIEDGKTGFVVSPDDKDGLVTALRKILESEDLRDQFGRECRRRALHYAYEPRKHRFERYILGS